MNYIVVKYSPSGEYARFYVDSFNWSFERKDAHVFANRTDAQEAAGTYSGAMVERIDYKTKSR
jgi:hypothetical protein